MGVDVDDSEDLRGRPDVPVAGGDRQPQEDLRGEPQGALHHRGDRPRANPQLARGDQIVAIPTLVKKLPPPLRRIIGDLSNSERVLIGLDIRSVDSTGASHGS